MYKHTQTKYSNQELCIYSISAITSSNNLKKIKMDSKRIWEVAQTGLIRWASHEVKWMVKNRTSGATAKTSNAARQDHIWNMLILPPLQQGSFCQRKTHYSGRESLVPTHWNLHPFPMSTKTNPNQAGLTMLPKAAYTWTWQVCTEEDAADEGTSLPFCILQEHLISIMLILFSGSQIKAITHIQLTYRELLAQLVSLM